MLEVAARTPIRGTLIDERRQPLGPLDLADMTGAPEDVFGLALSVLTRDDIDWIEAITPNNAEYSVICCNLPATAGHPADAGKKRPDITNTSPSQDKNRNKNKKNTGTRTRARARSGQAGVSQKLPGTHQDAVTSEADHVAKTDNGSPSIGHENPTVTSRSELRDALLGVRGGRATSCMERGLVEKIVGDPDVTPEQVMAWIEESRSKNNAAAYVRTCYTNHSKAVRAREASESAGRLTAQQSQDKQDQAEANEQIPGLCDDETLGAPTAVRDAGGDTGQLVTDDLFTPEGAEFLRTNQGMIAARLRLAVWRWIRDHGRQCRE